MGIMKHAAMMANVEFWNAARASSYIVLHSTTFGCSMTACPNTRTHEIANTPNQTANAADERIMRTVNDTNESCAMRSRIKGTTRSRRSRLFGYTEDVL